MKTKVKRCAVVALAVVIMAFSIETHPVKAGPLGPDLSGIP